MAVIDSRKTLTAAGVVTAGSEANPANKRRSMRVVIDVPVTVFGQNSSGKIFEEETRTITVSAHGGSVVLKTDIDAQKPALLVNKKTQVEVQCRIAHRKEVENRQFEIGFEFSEPLPRFWGVNFPPEDWNPADRKKATYSQMRPPAATREKVK